MKNPLFLLLIGLLTCFTFSCKEKDTTKPDQCGDEGFSALNVSNYATFSQASKLNQYGESNVARNGKTCIYQIQLHVLNICNSDKPSIQCSGMWKTPDTSVHFVGSFQEGSGPLSAFLLTSTVNMTTSIQNGEKFSDGTNELTFSPNIWGNNPASLTAKTECQFTTRGSNSADSAYFYSNIDLLKIVVNYHKPK